ncbi:uncharacterized protein LOC122798561 isoform X2 [Protopterus annectens]|uniref:uncharacterized protein LOC122798561 isoform X2 n=1 Tax=Protopterus annectens TaxID=7888 RepID=UPI001CFA7F15|nr:uncharacterized protein LOC122798561 isoform X2 [Protopterus annectens]
MNFRYLVFLVTASVNLKSSNSESFTNGEDKEYYILGVFDICTKQNSTNWEALISGYVLKTVVTNHNMSHFGYIVIVECGEKEGYYIEKVQELRSKNNTIIAVVSSIYTEQWENIFEDIPQIAVSHLTFDMLTHVIKLDGPVPTQDITASLLDFIHSKGWKVFNVVSSSDALYKQVADALRFTSKGGICVEKYILLCTTQNRAITVAITELMGKKHITNITIVLGNAGLIYSVLDKREELNVYGLQFVFCCLWKDELEGMLDMKSYLKTWKRRDDIFIVFKNRMILNVDDFLDSFSKARAENSSIGHPSACDTYEEFIYCYLPDKSDLDYSRIRLELILFEEPASQMLVWLERIISVMEHWNGSTGSTTGDTLYSFFQNSAACWSECAKGQHLVKYSRCCNNCSQCEPGTYGYGNETICKNCSHQQWSLRGSSECSNKTIIYLYWDSPEAISFLVLAITGGILTILVLVIYIKNSDSPIIKISGGFIFTCNLLGLFCCFLSVLLFIGEPTDWKCNHQVSVFGLSFSLCLSSVLAKSCRILMAFAGTTSKPTKTETKLYISVIVVGPVIQALICLSWMLMEPVKVSEEHHLESIHIICSSPSQLWLALVIGYLCLLALFSCFCAIKSKTLPSNFNNANMIAFSMLIFFCVWLSVIPALAAKRDKTTTVMMIIAILASAFGCLASLFFYNCYVILLHPERNTSAWIKQTNFNYCAIIAHKASLNIQLCENNDTQMNLLTAVSE